MLDAGLAGMRGSGADGVSSRVAGGVGRAEVDPGRAAVARRELAGKAKGDCRLA
jgi:hypothetical protein